MYRVLGWAMEMGSVVHSGWRRGEGISWAVRWVAIRKGLDYVVGG